MRKQVHILNGDVLKDRFPATILGRLLICRECLVEGNVEGENLEQLFINRAKFIQENYGASESEYYDKVITEFHSIIEIENSDINLWFEDDLFCQVNFWFITHLLNKKNRGNDVYLVRPPIHTPYGFGTLKEADLISIYKDRLPLKELDEISVLWKAYQMEDVPTMFNIAKELENKYPFIISAVEAHNERIPKEGELGRPIDSLIRIMKELKTNEFNAVFKEFNRREKIYGFSDLHVKRLMSQIKNVNMM